VTEVILSSTIDTADRWLVVIAVNSVLNCFSVTAHMYLYKCSAGYPFVWKAN
jgi:hypothetical protein